MPKFIFWIFSIASALAVGATLPAATKAMGRAALYAYENHQMSYAKFSKELTSRRHYP